MRPLIGVIALLVGAFVLATVEAKGRLLKCSTYPDEPCGDGWSRIDDERCAKYIRSPKTFPEAEDHCLSLNADLVSVHSRDQMAKLRCLTWPVDPQCSKGFWVGAKRVKFKFKSTDGSEFELHKCCHDEPKNYRGREGCIRLKFTVWASCKIVRCFKMKSFVCAKNMLGSSLSDQDQSRGSTPASRQQDVSRTTRHPILPSPTSVPPTGTSGERRSREGVEWGGVRSPLLTSLQASSSHHDAAAVTKETAANVTV